jgi:hypothetical protein
MFMAAAGEGAGGPGRFSAKVSVRIEPREASSKGSPETSPNAAHFVPKEAKPLECGGLTPPFQRNLITVVSCQGAFGAS